MVGPGATFFQIWTRRRKITLSGGSLVVLLYLFFVDINAAARTPSSHSQHQGVDRECNTIGNLIKSKGFSYPWWDLGNNRVPPFGSNSSSSGESGLCPVGKTGEKSTKCCRDLGSGTQRNEMTLAFNDKWLGPKLAANAEVFKDRKKKFDVTFKDLLTRAHAAFHAMFERTYGMLYIQHAPIFHALFNTLDAYYDNGRESLEGKLNEFFAILTRKMFEVLNAQYEFDEAYLSCATIVISEKQGNDLHRQIVSSLRRSFVATRALAQGLNDADRVFSNLQKLKISPECVSSLSEMLQCPICSEQRAYKPCIPLCTAVATSCLSSTTPMTKAWTEFTNALEAVLDRLLGPYNVEAVVEPIHIKISEAIMNFQESGPELSQAVFAKCGKPKLKSARKESGPGRSFTRREASSSSLADLEEHSADQPKRTQQDTLQADGFRGASPAADDMQPSKSLEKLLREIKNRVKKSKSVWDVLPRQVCNGISKDYSSQLCWNGSAPVRPVRNKTSEESDTIKATVSKGTTNILVAEQVAILHQISEKLRASYNGLDVQWVQEIEELDFGGSGMGSGSGEIPTDLEDSDDDDPSGQIQPDKKGVPKIFNPPSHPKFPLRPPPAILNPQPNHEDEEDEDEEDDDEDDNSSDNNVNWNSIKSNNNNNNGVTIGGEGIDFAPSPPKVNKNPPPPKIVPESTTTTTTTRRPDIEIRKTNPTTTSGASLDEAGKAIAFFKLFSPIFASLIGKAFSFK